MSNAIEMADEFYKTEHFKNAKKWWTQQGLNL